MLSQMGDKELVEKVRETEKKQDGLVSTYDKHWLGGKGVDARFDEERTKLHNKIIDDYINKAEGAICGDTETPTLILLGGRGGSGKSNFDGMVYDRKKYLVLDSDDIKTKIPEYKNWNASQVHEESSYLMKKILKIARISRMNVVIDGTMSSLESQENYLKDFKGYRTEAHYMYLPPQESFKRAMSRFKNGGDYKGRYVPARILRNMKDNEKVFDAIKGKVDNWSFYSNNVPMGEKPILIKKKR